MGSIGLPLYIVDTFTRFDSSAFSGNPAAVCVLDWDDEIEDEVKQDIAKEINQPATAFISRGWTCTLTDSKPRSIWTVRWFSCTSELSLCGHGSLAAARVLFEHFTPELSSVTLEARNGQHVDLSIDREVSLISARFPSCPPQKLNPEDSWVKELIQKTFVTNESSGAGSSRLILEDVMYSPGGRKILLHLKTPAHGDSEDVIRSVSPDINGMMEVVPTSLNIIGVGVTIQNNEDKGNQSPLFFTRFFAPWVGIDEDEVCGSLHAVLAPYWSNKLGREKERMMNRFLSTRTGDVYVKLENDRVCITGKTFTKASGTFFLQN